MAGDETLSDLLFRLELSYSDLSADPVFFVEESPRHALRIVYDCFCAMRILVIDDAELNPGRTR